MYVAQLPLFERKNFSISFEKPSSTLNKILSQFGLEEICSFFSDEIERINLWASKKPTSSSWHYDSYDNFLFMIEGQKTFYLYPPNEPSMKCEALTTESFQ